jgi:hypothetical protein
MDESNGTNLKPILPILFFNKLMNVSLVLVPSPDRWRERALGTSTKLGRKVLTFPFNRNMSQPRKKQVMWIRKYSGCQFLKPPAAPVPCFLI